MQNFSKSIDKMPKFLRNLNILPLISKVGSKGVRKNFDTAMLIYKHWVTMVYSENLLNIIALKKREDYNTKN